MTFLGLILALLLALGFGVQQCNKNAATQGDLKARADTLSFWKDKAGTEHARVGQLVTSQSFAQKMLDSLKTIKGSKTTAVTHLAVSAEEILRPDNIVIDNGWIRHYRDLDVIADDSSVDNSDAFRQAVGDTSTYHLTAADTLAWLRSSTRFYKNRYDTVEVSWDSAIIHMHDSLIVVESENKVGGFFNRQIVHTVDVYHENPRFRTLNVRAWRLAVPVKRWALGPSMNFYPKFDNGIKLGVSAGVSLTYNLISF